MPESPSEHRWADAVGVLPLESVLAQEHEFIHGDDTTARIDAVEIAFTDDQIIDPVAFTDRFLEARTVDQLQLDAVAGYILGALSAERRASLEAALDVCSSARGRHDPRTHTSDSIMHVSHDASSPVRAADAAFVRAMVAHLNTLLATRLDLQPAFRPFIEAGAVPALGWLAKNTEAIANRLLIEAAFEGQVSRLQDLRLDEVFTATRLRDTSALCLSGGGIRSATFANGVLRGFAKHGLLGRFDYLSTVSGGGYAGSWLSAWMHHVGAPEVQQQMGSAAHDKLAPEPAPMRHLRAYSHFLTPRVGAFSADTWTLGATIARNMLFNWAVLLPLMAAALLVPRFVLALVRVDYCDITPGVRPHAGTLLVGMFLVGVAALMYGLRYLHRYRPQDDDDARHAPGERRARAGTQSDFIYRCFIPLCASAVIMTLQFYLWWDWNLDGSGDALAARCVEGAAQASRLIAIDPVTQNSSIIETLFLNVGLAGWLLLLGAISHFGAWVLSGRPRRHLGEWFLVLLSGAVAGGTALFLVMWFVTRADTLGRDAVFTTLAAPAFLGVLLIGSQLLTALSSRNAADAEREWVARFNAWLLIAMVMWITACVFVLFGPDWVEKGWSKLTLLAVGGSSGIIGLLVARSGSSSSAVPPPGITTFLKKAALALAAPLFAGAIIIGLAASNESLIQRSCSITSLGSFLDCRLRPVNSDAVTHSQPFIVRARHMTDDLNAMAGRLHTTGADSTLASAFARGADTASEAAARRSYRAAHWDSLVLGTYHQVIDAAKGTTIADDSLRADMTAFKRAVFETDSTIAGTIGGDPLERDSLLRARLGAVHRAGRVLHFRRLRRDTAATQMDAHLTTLVQLEKTAPATPGLRRADTLEAMREIVDTRLRGSIDLFNSIRRDSSLIAESADSVLRQIGNTRILPYDGAVPVTIVILFGVLVLTGGVFGWRIDTNKFSLRAMYEMRLVRAYLGASRPPVERRPNPFTGFDPNDDIPMGKLWPNWGRTPAGAGRSPTSPPFHLVNTTLNLVGGAGLAWQQRKAESMTISPLHAGSAFVGYRATSKDSVPADLDAKKRRLYGGDHGVTLGTAVTISGAAASPNAGAMSSPVATFLMTFFNARLGAWLGNPGRAGAKTYHRGAPKQIVRPILAEMFGMTTDRSEYVALSDGGHFENLALYEMVLRRCRFIVVSDAGCDPKAAFDDLGNAVRKIRVDLGVPIEFPDGVDIHARDNKPESGGAYWAVGRIRYSAVDRSADAAHTDGVLIYIKPALYDREPSDVQQYARMSDTFPHESTADQFFSESQFESYRALGEFIVTKLVEGPLSTQQDVTYNNEQSLFRHWSDLSKAAVTTPHTILTEGSAWPTSAGKRTG